MEHHEHHRVDDIDDSDLILEGKIYHGLCEKQLEKCRKDNDERYITHRSIRLLVYSLIGSALVVACSVGVFIFNSGIWVKGIETTATSAKETANEIKNDQTRILNRDDEIKRTLENLGEMVSQIRK